MALIGAAAASSLIKRVHGLVGTGAMGEGSASFLTLHPPPPPPTSRCVLGNGPPGTERPLPESSCKNTFCLTYEEFVFFSLVFFPPAKPSRGPSGGGGARL